MVVEIYRSQTIKRVECVIEVAFHAEIMGDIMCLQQALRQPDAKEFAQATIKEVNEHVDCNNWKLRKGSEVPEDEDVQIVPSICALQCKRNLTTNKIKSHKARLYLNSGKQVYGMNYFETYAPVVTRFAISLMIIFGIIFVGPFNKWTLLCNILKLQPRWTSTWNCHKGSKPSTGIPRITY